MKKHKFILLISFVFLLGSCKKSFLDRKPLGDLSDASFWKTEGDLLSATNDIYYLLSNNSVEASFKFGSQWFPYAFNAPVNDVQVKIPDTKLLANQIFTGDNLWLNVIWRGLHKGIARANRVIAHAPSMEISADFRDKKIAEAKCLRGIFYLMLVRAYGDVPLLLEEPTGASDLHPKRTPKAEVLAQIVKDLTEAAAVLPKDWDGANVGRVTKGTALGYMALTNLYEEKWSDAVTNTEALKALGKYDLWTEYKDVYKWPDAENGKESVFEIQYANAPSQDQFLQSFLGPSHANGILKNGNLWSELFPSKQFREAFEPGDERRWQILSNGETHTVFDGSAGMKTYTMDSVGNLSTGGLAIRKYWIGIVTDGRSSPQNIYLNKFSDAYDLINKIRFRAGLPPKPVAGDVETTITDINNERRFENFLDANHWFDLTRTKQAKKFLLEEYGINMPDRNYLYPLPNDEIQLNSNLLPNNPGY
jgi:hypothetical protein